MSLGSRWKVFELSEEYDLVSKAKLSAFWRARLRKAFYAGTKAVLDEDADWSSPANRSNGLGA